MLQVSTVLEKIANFFRGLLCFGAYCIKGVIRNYTEVKNSLYYGIKIKHWYSVEICCILG